MTARDLGSVGLKLLGLMAILQALQTAVAMFGYMFFFPGSEPHQMWTLLPGVMMTLVMVALGVSIVAYAKPIAERLFPERGAVQASFGAEELWIVLFSAVGAFLVFESLPAFLSDLVGLVTMSRQGLDPVGGGFRGQNGLDLAEAALRTGLGLLLLLGGRNVVGVVWRLRRVGSSEG